MTPPPVLPDITVFPATVARTVRAPNDTFTYLPLVPRGRSGTRISTVSSPSGPVCDQKYADPSAVAALCSRPSSAAGDGSAPP
eukprot:CAMPEP_0194267388 /NCGR_PEP_ID=MMETSP0169-20130528/1908_1 /TAXON_ID=218684 /ORGANISM="Corethron pennatum, Strain L29A3" /LENGTH=82 /DNA_ID=CAMNT_0039008213 /DNA_START=267 /DNA_END=512 /DNA_ORIENTATION=+